jgi:hypothetical protein
LKLADIPGELAYPLSQPVLAIALVFFWLLLSIATHAGLYGLFLLLVLLPAYSRYLLAILEARAHGQRPEPPTAEMFSLTESLWTLFPLLPVAAVIWIEFFIAAQFGPDFGRTGTFIAVLPLLAFVALMPASLAILTMTRSPLASINPRTLVNVIRRSLPGYLLIPALMVAVSAGIYGLMIAGVPGVLLDLGDSYALFLFCSLTGAVMHQNAFHLDVDIPAAIEPDAAVLDRKLSAERKAVAVHAYGFISRGNREGGLRHIRERIDAEADVDAAYQWFFDEMMSWESGDAALYFAQPYLSRLLRLEQESAAIRLLTRCVHRNPRFRTLDQDRQLVARLLEKYRRHDLLAVIENRGSVS